MIDLNVIYAIMCLTIEKLGEAKHMKSSNDALIDACLNNDSAAAITAIDDSLAQIDTTAAGGGTKKNLSRSTPIIIASARDHGLELLSVLLGRGADITIRTTGYWYPFNESSTTTNKISEGNALDVALFFGNVNTVKKLLLHAALYLDSDKQSKLLERMPQKNILLYVAMTYPQYMDEMVKQILAQNDITLSQRIMCELASSHEVTPALIDKYLNLFVSKEDLDKRMPTLVKAQFDTHLNWFKALSSNKHANILIKDLDDAKFKFLFDGNTQTFNQSVLDAIQVALPTLGKQAAWKVAIGHFLEVLAGFVPMISRKHIEFYKKTDVARKLEQMQAQLFGIPSAPLSVDTIDIPEAVVVELDKNLGNC